MEHAEYGWVIDKDHLFDPEVEEPEDIIYDEAGTMGPRNISPDIENKLGAGAGQKFQMFDDDDELYYSGRYLGPDDETVFGPLEDYGTPNAGATSISYWNAETEQFEEI